MSGPFVMQGVDWGLPNVFPETMYRHIEQVIREMDHKCPILPPGWKWDVESKVETLPGKYVITYTATPKQIIETPDD